MNASDSQRVYDTVREGYGRIATAGSWSAAQTIAEVEEKRAATSCCGGGCCGSSASTAEDMATAVGYSMDELAGLPEGANMGLSCGNPAALAALKPGEYVLDLGAGGGFDCFIAGPRVGARGRVIGVDMTPEMVRKARGNIAAYEAHNGLRNVEFRLGEIEHLPIADASIDVVISNCVLNLSPEKAQVWREVSRVLKPGGRVAVSDMALLQPLPASMLADVEALVGCVAGAVLIDETRAMMRAAGFDQIVITPKPDYVGVMTSWQDPLYRKLAGAVPSGANMSDFVTSVEIAARKSMRTWLGR